MAEWRDPESLAVGDRTADPAGNLWRVGARGVRDGERYVMLVGESKHNRGTVYLLPLPSPRCAKDEAAR